MNVWGCFYLILFLRMVSCTQDLAVAVEKRTSRFTLTEKVKGLLRILFTRNFLLSCKGINSNCFYHKNLEVILFLFVKAHKYKTPKPFVGLKQPKKQTKNLVPRIQNSCFLLTSDHIATPNLYDPPIFFPSSHHFHSLHVTCIFSIKRPKWVLI